MEEKSLAIRQDTKLASYLEISSMAKAFYESGMFSDTKSQAQAIVKIIAGAELGLPAVYSMQNINLIRSRLTSSANTLAMLVKRSGKYDYRITEHNEQKCSIDFYQKDEKLGNSTFTMEDAKRADLIKPDSGWIKYPRAMLFSRAISQGARIYCPDAIGGIYTDEEMMSIPWDDSKTPPLSSVEEPFDETLSAESEVVQEHWCPVHKSEFFKRGKMKAYAHPIEGSKDASGKSKWCYEHKNTPVEPVNSNVPDAAVTPSDSNPVVNRPPSDIISLSSLLKACKADFNLDGKQVFDTLGINSSSEWADSWSQAYSKIAIANKE
jgi:hypothetical protein